MSETAPTEAALSHLLHRAVQAAADLHAGLAGPEGLTPRQFAVLSAIASAEGSTQTQLVRTTGVDRSTLAELVARLAERGLLDRSRSGSDARANQVSLTEAGRNLLEASRPLAAEADLALLSRLPEDRRARFLKDLRRLVAAPEDAGGDKPRKKKKKKKKAEKAAA